MVAASVIVQGHVACVLVSVGKRGVPVSMQNCYLKNPPGRFAAYRRVDFNLSIPSHVVSEGSR